MHEQTAVAALGSTFVAHYGAVFVWHALSAVFAWAFLAPVGFAWMRACRRAGGDVILRGHRTIMVAVVVLTVQAWAIAVAKSRKTPTAHALLGSAILLLAILQATWGTMRPATDGGMPRSVWAAAHRGVAALAIVVATYTCHHSIYVFSLPTIAAIVIHSTLAFSAVIIIAAEFAPRSLCQRVTGRRTGFFDHEPEDPAQKLPDDPLGSGVGFRVVEDDIDDVVDEEAALALSTGNSHQSAPS